MRSKFDRESRIWCGGRRFRLSGRPFSVVWPTCTHGITKSNPQSVGHKSLNCLILPSQARTTLKNYPSLLFIMSGQQCLRRVATSSRPMQSYSLLRASSFTAARLSRHNCARGYSALAKATASMLLSSWPRFDSAWS